MDTRNEIDRWRGRIDEVDQQLLNLINERSRCALAIGLWKKRHAQPVYDPIREADIIERILGENKGPLEDEAIRRVFERILDESRRLERMSSNPSNTDDTKEKN